MKNIYPYKQQNDTQHFNSFACYCLKINKYSSANVEDERLCITTPNTCKRDISFEIFFIHVYPRVRCLLTINGGNVINASCLTAQYFNY